MDLRVIERACAEQGGHYNDKAIGEVGNRVAAAGEGLVCAPHSLMRRHSAGCVGTARYGGRAACSAHSVVRLARRLLWAGGEGGRGG